LRVAPTIECGAKGERHDDWKDMKTGFICHASSAVWTDLVDRLITMGLRVVAIFTSRHPTAPWQRIVGRSCNESVGVPLYDRRRESDGRINSFVLRFLRPRRKLCYGEIQITINA